MDREPLGGWVYIMADRYRGALYVGVTSSLAARVTQHRAGTGSDYCSRRGLTRLVWAERGDAIDDCIAHEKRLKRWRRKWKFALIEKANPDWDDSTTSYFDDEKHQPRIRSGATARGYPSRHSSART